VIPGFYIYLSRGTVRKPAPC